MTKNFYIMSPHIKGKKCRYIRGQLLFRGKPIKNIDILLGELKKISNISLCGSSGIEEVVLDGILLNNKFIIFDIIPYKNFIKKRYDKRYKDRVDELGKLSVAIELLGLSHLCTMCWLYFGSNTSQLLKNFYDLHTDVILNCNEKYFQKNAFCFFKSQNSTIATKAFK